MEPRVNLITLGVSDVQRARRCGYTGYFADPDGHLWEVAWNPHFILDEDGRLTLPK
jgi:hypothetical protein